MDIIVVGYPKSGNTWLSRLLGDAIQCPITGWGNKHPIAGGGDERLSTHVIRQLHVTPKECGKELIDGKFICENHWDRDKVRVIHAVRDPRDVTISAMYYWGLPSLQQALICVGEGTWPLTVGGKWQEFVTSWKGIVPVVRYRDLHMNPKGELNRILSLLGLESNNLEEVIDRQSFNKQRSKIRAFGHKMPYGRGIQMKNLRLGTIGDWENHFLEEDEEQAERYFGQAARQYGFMEAG